METQMRHAHIDKYTETTNRRQLLWWKKKKPVIGTDYNQPESTSPKGAEWLIAIQLVREHGSG